MKKQKSDILPLGGLRKGALSGLVFFAGIGSMATEMCASRLLAPYYGSSTMIWANIIGLVLIALSVGYVVGGKLADRYPSAKLLGLLVLAGAVITAVVPFAARPFLNVTISGIDTVSTGAVIGSFAASVVLFVPSVILLGMVTRSASDCTTWTKPGRPPGGSSPSPRPEAFWEPSRLPW
jgi:MFS family permease